MKLNGQITDEINFYQGIDPFDLVKEYGSPLYVYNEAVFRKNCRDIKSMSSYPKFSVNYSIKANGNLGLLQIARQEGLNVDAMSPGEITVELKAGFKPEQIFYIGNNVSREEMRFAIDRSILMSVDSVSQLEQYGQLNPGGRVAVRFNPGVGAGHHEKVITAGKHTKFGVNKEYIPDVKAIISKYSLKLVGINQHIGSLIMTGDKYIESVSELLTIASHFEDLEFIDMGGGFGVPYKKQDGEKRLDLKELGERLTEFMYGFSKSYGKELAFKIEPGRYIPAESGVLLGTVHAVKYNGEDKYIGTDLGFNVLVRPVMYGSHHDIEVYRESGIDTGITEKVNIVGNICETGDQIALNRVLPEIKYNDLIGVLDAGAYGHVMSSNYNFRLRPAEVLIRQNGEVSLIRERDTLDDILFHMRGIE